MNRESQVHPGGWVALISSAADVVVSPIVWIVGILFLAVLISALEQPDRGAPEAFYYALLISIPILGVSLLHTTWRYLKKGS